MTSDPVDHLLLKSRPSDQVIVPSTHSPSTPLSPGQVVLKLGAFNLTANNVTYALLGPDPPRGAGYWRYFPVAKTPLEPEWSEVKEKESAYGRLPVWGIAEVVESASPGVDVGTKVFGYFPISTYSVMTLGPLGEGGQELVETSPERNKPGLLWLYQRYRVLPSEMSQTEENKLVVWYIPFLTAFALAPHTLRKFPGEKKKKTVLLLSASSKTALATAAVLKHSGQCDRVLGLSSSEQSKAVAKNSGWYDDVWTFDAFPGLGGEGEEDEEVVLVDLAGRGSRTRALQDSLGRKWKCTVLVGLSDHKHSVFGSPEELHAATAVRSQGADRIEQFNLGGPGFLDRYIQELGGEVYETKLAEDLKRFLEQVGEGGGEKEKYERKSGMEELKKRWGEVYEGLATAGKEVLLEL